MKRNLLFVPFVAVLTLLFVSFASAAELADNVQTRFNDVVLTSTAFPLSGNVGDSVPIRVTFDALEDARDVRIRVRMEGHREDISASTERFNTVGGTAYTKTLSLRLPTTLRETDRLYTLYVDIVSADHETRETYPIILQRTSYGFRILSVDYNSRVVTGEVVPVSVVVRNEGFNTLDDVFVMVSIPELGITSRGYVGDLVPVDVPADAQENAASKTVYFRVPNNAQPGVYEMEVVIYNEDTELSTKRLISIGEVAAVNVIATVKNRDIRVGETVTYELIIVNNADNVGIFQLREVSGRDLTVSVPSVVTVGPRASETVQISVTADRGTEVGTRTFSVEVDGRSVVFGANVVGDGVSPSVVALTVILVIVFIVLLAVLIILLTRKEKPMEEVETSYY
jgi:hypothetical protein